MSFAARCYPSPDQQPPAQLPNHVWVAPVLMFAKVGYVAENGGYHGIPPTYNFEK